jgi:IS5 family transposase
MGPKDTSERVSDMFRQPLIELLNPRYELVRLAAVMDWRLIEASFSKHFASTTGRPALSPRLVAGLLYLQHVYDCSDEVAVNTWVENPYWQHYTGETYFQTEAPIDPSSLTRWRKRVGEEGVETMLMATIEAGRKLGLLKQSSIDRVIEDTTVMPKAIAHPTDSRLLEKSRQHLVALAKEEGLTLRQNYNREAPRLAAQIGCYAHAKQYRRMKKSLRTLRWRVGRVMRDVGRQIERIDPSRQNRARYIPSKANRILTQKTQDKNKLYAFHAPSCRPRSLQDSRL